MHHHHTHNVPVPVPGPTRYVTEERTNTVPYKVETPVPYPVQTPVEVLPPAPVPARAPNSKVMRAIADANEASAKAKVKEQRDVARKMERIEHEARVNESINESVKREE